jgi:hypothetical protein
MEYRINVEKYMAAVEESWYKKMRNQALQYLPVVYKRFAVVPSQYIADYGITESEFARCIGVMPVKTYTNAKGDNGWTVFVNDGGIPIELIFCNYHSGFGSHGEPCDFFPDEKGLLDFALTVLLDYFGESEQVHDGNWKSCKDFRRKVEGTRAWEYHEQVMKYFFEIKKTKRGGLDVVADIYSEKIAYWLMNDIGLDPIDSLHAEYAEMARGIELLKTCWYKRMRKNMVRWLVIKYVIFRRVPVFYVLEFGITEQEFNHAMLLLQNDGIIIVE